MGVKITRIGIGSKESPQSTLWSITISKSDVYIAQRSSFAVAKVSLHDSGKWRFAANSLNWNKTEDRALVKWDRPHQVFKSVVLGPTLVFPSIVAVDPLAFSDSYNKPIEWLSPAMSNEERVVMVMFSLGKKDAEDYIKKSGLSPDWLVTHTIKNNSRLNADTVSIISWKESMRESTKIQIVDVLEKMKIHYKKASSPDGISAVATPFYLPNEEEKARGLSPTIIEIALGKGNLEEDKI